MRDSPWETDGFGHCWAVTADTSLQCCIEIEDSSCGLEDCDGGSHFYKKLKGGGWRIRSNYSIRGSHHSASQEKLMLERRLQPIVEPWIQEKQCRFCHGCGTVPQQGTLWIMLWESGLLGLLCPYTTAVKDVLTISHYSHHCSFTSKAANWGGLDTWSRCSRHVQLVGECGADPEDVGGITYLSWPENDPLRGAGEGRSLSSRVPPWP